MLFGGNDKERALSNKAERIKMVNSNYFNKPQQPAAYFISILTFEKVLY
jgi:hypothetical protein